VLIAHKIGLDSTIAQRRSAGTAPTTGRRRAGGKPSDTSLRKELNAIKRAKQQRGDTSQNPAGARHADP
jgi:hypothetical protein